MGWSTTLTLSLLITSHVISQPLETEKETADRKEAPLWPPFPDTDDDFDFNTEDVKMLLEKLFIEGFSRTGRTIDIDVTADAEPQIDPVEGDIMSYSGDSETDNRNEEVEETVPNVGENSESQSEKAEDKMPVFEEKKADPQEVTRFNNYMDAIYRRMNAALRAKLMDPMTLNLDQQEKRKEKNRVTRSTDETDEGSEGRAFTKKDKNKKKKNKKKGAKKGKKSSKHTKQERSDTEKKSNKKAHKTAEEKRKANKKAAEKKDTPKITMKDMRDAKTLGSLAGIASLRRSGDVMIQDVEDHKVITSTFTVGPLSLEVSKTYKNGKSKSVRTAKAVTEVMYGTIQLKVKLDGSAHVKKVVFKNPESVEVAGSVTDSRQRSDTYLRNSVKRMRPLAAQKILKTARYVLRAPSAVRRN